MKLVTLNPRTMLVDTKGVHVTTEQVREASVKHFGMETVGEQIGRKSSGILLSANLLNFYRMKSVDADIVIVSKDKLTPEQSRPLALAYVAQRG